MANDHDDHLTPDVLNRIVTNRASDSEQAAAKAHGMTCAVCAARLCSYRDAEERLENFRFGSGLDASENCPQAEEWVRLDCGELTDVRANELLDHAVTCGYCSAQLRAVLDDQVQSNVREGNLAPGVQSVRPESGIYPAGSPRVQGKLARWWAGAAIAACLALVFGALWFVRGSKKPETLLAHAYSEARPFEMRFPGAAYGPIRRTRSAEGSLSRPKSLLEAESEIRDLPDNGRSLFFRGTLELLNQHYDAAIRLLEQARAAPSEHPQTGLVLAIALFQRGQMFSAAERHQDFLETLNLLQEFLAKHPDDQTALFNLALCYQAVEDLPQAIDTWKKFLKRDPNSSWAGEARTHLLDLQNRLEKRGKAERELRVTDPSRFLALSHSGAQILPELFLSAAFTAWLPRGDRPHERAALHALAGMFRDRSTDLFLVDLLDGPPSSKGFASLAGALEANRMAMPARAQDQALVAERLFAMAGNRPGVLRARAERLYALHRLYRPECIEVGSTLDRDLRGKPYPWLGIQVRLELANCHAFRNDYGRAAMAAVQARNWAKKMNLPDLELRSTGLLAAFRFYAGDSVSVIRDCLPALSRYWDFPYPPNRAQQFFHNLALASDNLGWHYAAASFTREKISVMLGTQETLLEARGRVSLARLAFESGDFETASMQLEKARQLFAASPNGDAKTSLESDAEIDRAAVELARSHDTGALISDLTKLADPNSGISTDEGRLRALELLAHALSQQQQWEQARSRLREAIRIHEGRLAGLHSEWERVQSAEQHASLYRELSEIQFSHDHDPTNAFATWFSNRAPLKNGQVQGWDPHSDRSVLAVACLPGGPVVWATSELGITGRRIAGSDEDLLRESIRLARVAADPAMPIASINLQAAELKSRIFVVPFLGLAHRAITIDLDYCVAPLPLLLVFPDGFSQAGLWAGGTDNPKLELAQMRGLVISAPQLSGEFASLYPPLPDVGAETAQVAAQFGIVATLSGPQATLGGLSQHLPGSSIVHFAGHGIGFGGSGSVLLAPGDPLTAEFDLLTAGVVGSQDWSHCDLAVLSACSTAGGASASAQSSNLVRAFLAAGARRVVASLWNVDSGATRALMSSFYRNMRDGVAPAQALARAAGDVRAKSQWNHPYYWAAFQMFGEL